MNNQSQFLLCTAPDGAVKVDVFCQNEAVWPTREATISKMEITRPEGGCDVAGQEIVGWQDHYTSPACPAVKRPNTNSRGWNPRAIDDGWCDPYGVECDSAPAPWVDTHGYSCFVPSGQLGTASDGVNHNPR